MSNDRIISHDFGQHLPTSKRVKWQKNGKLVLDAKSVAQIIKMYLGALYEFADDQPVEILSGQGDDGQPMFVVQDHVS